MEGLHHFNGPLLLLRARMQLVEVKTAVKEKCRKHDTIEGLTIHFDGLLLYLEWLLLLPLVNREDAEAALQY